MFSVHGAEVLANGRKGAGRPNLLDDDLLAKTKDIIIGTRQAGAVISRRVVIAIGTGVVKANQPNLLKEYGGPLELTEDWARYLLKSMEWVKRKGTTGKTEPSEGFLSEEKFTFQKAISKAVYENDIPLDLVINLDQTPLGYVSPGKYTFAMRGSKSIPIKGVDDKRQITATFAVSATGVFLPIQIIYQGKTKRCKPKFQFPGNFHVTYTPNHWSNTEKCVEFLEKIIFPYLKRVKQERGYPTEQWSLIIMDCFKGQDNDIIIFAECEKKFCVIVLVPRNLTNRFQPLDLTVNRPAKSFITNKCNIWYSRMVRDQLVRGVSPRDVKISLQLSTLKPLHARWIVDAYNHMKTQKDTIVKGFEKAGIMEAINRANEVILKCENPFKENDIL